MTTKDSLMLFYAALAMFLAAWWRLNYDRISNQTKVLGVAGIAWCLLMGGVLLFGTGCATLHQTLIYDIDPKWELIIEKSRERGQCWHPEQTFHVQGPECCTINGYECCRMVHVFGPDWLDCNFHRGTP